MSEVLLEFAQPLSGDHPTEQRLRAVLDQMVLLWNLGVLPQDAQELYWRQIEATLREGLPADVAPEYLRELRAWLRWRKTHYGHDRRAISHYALEWSPDGPRLSVYFTERDRTP